MRIIPVFVALVISVSAMAQDARRIIEPLEPAIIDNATIVAVTVTPSATAAAAIVKLDKAAARKAASRKAGKPAEQPAATDTAELARLPFADMFPLVMKDIAREFHLEGDRRIKLAVSIDTIKQPNGFLALVASSDEEIAGVVEVSDADDGRPLGVFHIDVINTYGMGFGLDALSRGAPREFLAREFSREAVRVLAGRKAREKPAKP